MRPADPASILPAPSDVAGNPAPGALHAAALEACSEGIAILDVRVPGFPLVYVNRGWERQTGYRRDEVLGQSARFIHGPHTEEESVEKLREALRLGKPCVAELLSYRRDGHPYWNRISISPMRDETGEVTHFISIQSDVSDHILGNTQVRDALELLEKTNEQLTRINRRMRKNLEAAARVQQAMLPETLPRVKGARFAWRFQPCEELAGDILNVFKLDRTHVGVYLLDVTGHGTAAALLAVSVARLLSPIQQASSLVRRFNPNDPDAAPVIVPPHEVADKLNLRFPWEPETAQFFTLVYGVLDTVSGEFRYVSAGHPDILLAPAGREPQFDRGKGLPIGVADEPYEEQVLQLAPGDRLLLYSDGITECMNNAREAFGRARLGSCFSEVCHSTLDACLEDVLRGARSWQGSPRNRDDWSLVALELKAP